MVCNYAVWYLFLSVNPVSEISPDTNIHMNNVHIHEYSSYKHAILPFPRIMLFRNNQGQRSYILPLVSNQSYRFWVIWVSLCYIKLLFYMVPISMPICYIHYIVPTSSCKHKWYATMLYGTYFYTYFLYTLYGTYFYTYFLYTLYGTYFFLQTYVVCNYAIWYLFFFLQSYVVSNYTIWYLFLSGTSVIGMLPYV